MFISIHFKMVRNNKAVFHNLKDDICIGPLFDLTRHSHINAYFYSLYRHFHLPICPVLLHSEASSACVSRCLSGNK